MFKTPEEESEHLLKKLKMINILGIPGAILLGLGLYGFFEAEGDAFISILNDRYGVYAFIGIGAASMVWVNLAMIAILKRRAELAKRMKRGSSAAESNNQR